MNLKKAVLFSLFFIACLGMNACQGDRGAADLASETPTFLPVPTSTASPTASLTPTNTPTATPTPTPTPTATPTLWLLEETPLPADFTPVAVENAPNFSAIAEWKGMPVVDLEWIPGTLELAVASPDSIELYELASRTPYRRLYPQAGEIVDIVFSPDQNWLVSGSRRLGTKGAYTSELEIWSGPDLKPQGILTVISSGITRLAFTPSSRSFISAYTEPEPEQLGRLEIRRVPGWAVISRLSTGTVLELAVFGDGARLATSPDRYHLQLWDLNSGKIVLEIPTSFTGAVSSLVFSPDRTTLASGHYDGTIRLWNVNTGELILEIASDGIINTLDFSPDGSVLASGNGGTQAVVRLWSANTGELLRELPGHSAAITRLLFSVDGRFLVSGSYDGMVRLWGVWP